MKILVTGSFSYQQYEPALANALKEINEEVKEFKWKDFFYCGTNPVLKFSSRFQNRFLYGPTINKLNKELIKVCEDFCPDLVFLYRGTHIQEKTVMKMIKMGITVFSYNNDDPFSGIPSDFYWRHYTGALKRCSHNFVYRVKNIHDMEVRGIKNTSILRSYYIESKNYHIPTIEKTIDVLFIGHFENDGRDECLMHIISHGIEVRIFGDNGWRKSNYYNELKAHLEIRPLDLNEYNLKINTAKIALVFLSKINTDTYTRRCFEIPATKTMMLSEYTPDLNSLFMEGEEAEYFRNKDELLNKVMYYLKNDEKRIAIGEKGYARLMVDGHEIKNRAEYVMKVFHNIKGDILYETSVHTRSIREKV